MLILVPLQQLQAIASYISYIANCLSQRKGNIQTYKIMPQILTLCQRATKQTERLLCTLHSLPMTFLETSCTFAEASATAVSAMISACIEPKPPVTLLCKTKIKTILKCDYFSLKAFYVYLSSCAVVTVYGQLHSLQK